MSGQLSFFSATAQPARPEDLAGLLCGPGQLVRRPPGARVSVLVADRWRIDALLDELALRELPAEAVRSGELVSVRTAFLTTLAPLADRWGGSGGGKRAPAGLSLDGPMLRLWYLAAGRPWEAGHALGLGEHDEAGWATIGAALAAAGLPGTLVGPRGDGPAYRLTGRRRLTRLGELVGEPPPGCPAGAWPA